MPKQLDWLKAICPICNEQYVYVEAFKPVTCGKRQCVESELGQKLINKV